MSIFNIRKNLESLLITFRAFKNAHILEQVKENSVSVTQMRGIHDTRRDIVDTAVHRDMQTSMEEAFYSGLCGKMLERCKKIFPI